MIKRILLLLVCFGFTFNVYSQVSNENINEYKYVIIPLQYDFVKGKNTYRLSTLAKLLFKQNNFIAFFDEEKLPNDLFKDRCTAIYADIISASGGFRKRNLQIVLNDCYGKEILRTDTGSSGENNHEKAYQEALRKAFKTIERLNYKYKPVEKKDIKESTKKNEPNISVAEENKKNENAEEDLNYVQETVIETVEEEEKQYEYIKLTAKEIENGYLLLDGNDKVVYKALRTLKENLYVLEGVTGIVFETAGVWFIEYYIGDEHNTMILEIKFQ